MAFLWELTEELEGCKFLAPGLEKRSFLSSKMVRTFREQMPQRAIQSNFHWTQASCKRGVIPPTERHLRISARNPSPEDQQEHPANTKFTNHTDFKTPTLGENSISNSGLLFFFPHDSFVFQFNSYSFSFFFPFSTMFLFHQLFFFNPFIVFNFIYIFFIFGLISLCSISTFGYLSIFF